MITDRMTLKEMLRELEADYDEVCDKMFTKHRMSRLKRALMKNRNCYVTNSFFVNSSRRNRYACIIAVNGWENYQKWVFHKYIIAIYDTDSGKYAATIARTKGPGVDQNTVSRYQPHFFSRYAERMGIDLTGEALIMHFFQRNNMCCLNMNPLKRNEEEMFAATAEGLSLGYCEGWDIKFNTFIPYDGLGKAKYEISQEQLEYLQDLIIAKYGSFIKSEDRMPFFTEEDMMVEITERNMSKDDVRPSLRFSDAFYGNRHMNALFEFAMRKSFSETKEKRTE